MSGWVLTFAVTLALVVSAGGTAISAFGYQAVRGTPLERPIGALLLMFIGMTSYHVLLLFVPVRSFDARLVEAVVYTTVGVFVVVMVYFQRTIDDGFVVRRS